MGREVPDEQGQPTLWNRIVEWFRRTF